MNMDSSVTRAFGGYGLGCRSWDLSTALRKLARVAPPAAAAATAAEGTHTSLDTEVRAELGKSLDCKVC